MEYCLWSGRFPFVKFASKEKASCGYSFRQYGNHYLIQRVKSEMLSTYLYSIILELGATDTTTIPASMGHQAHALFLDLVRQVDPALSSRLHNEQEYRPFTVSMLSGVNIRNGKAFLQMGQPYRLRITLLDGDHLWQNLSAYFLET